MDFFIYLKWSESISDIKKLSNKNSLNTLLSNEFISYSKENAVSKFKAASKLINQSSHFLYLRKKELNTLDDFIKIFEKEFVGEKNSLEIYF